MRINIMRLTKTTFNQAQRDFDAIEAPDYYEDDHHEQWEQATVTQILAEPEELADTLSMASAEEYDTYTAALAELLSSDSIKQLPDSWYALRTSIESIIVKNINRDDGYDKHIEDIHSDNAINRFNDRVRGNDNG